MKRSVLLFALAVSLTGCAGGDKCSKAIDKVIGYARQMMDSMSGLAGDNAASMKDEMEKKLAEGKGKALGECRKALSENREATEKTLDCVLASSNMMDLAKCDGAENLMKME